MSLDFTISNIDAEGSLRDRKSAKSTVLAIVKEIENEKADRAVIRTEGSFITVALLRGREEIKTLKIKNISFETITSFLDIHQSVFSHSGAGGGFFRDRDSLISYRVTKTSRLAGGETCALGDIKIYPLKEEIDKLFEEDKSISNFINSKNITILVSPSAVNLPISLGAFLGLSELNYVGSIDEINPETVTDSMEPFVVSVVASDSIIGGREVLRKLANIGVKDSIDLICLGVIPRLCSACSKEIRWEKDSTELLPVALRPEDKDLCKVGRGCEQCGNTGFHGNIFISNHIHLNKDAIELLRGEEPLEKIAEEFYKKGVRPLLDIGLQEVYKGNSTLDSVKKVAKPIGEHFEMFYNGSSNDSRTTSMTKLSFDTDETVPPQPLRGQAAFTGDIKQDQTIVGRDKPLLLIVEDDPNQRGILEILLKTADYEVITAENGVQAFAALKGDVPNLIVTDLMMPKMDGKEFVSLIKAHQVLRHIPVLVLTVISDSEKEYELLDLGADDYCEKTVPRKILLKRIENLIKRSSVIAPWGKD